RAYSSAVRINCALATGLPSSLTATAPAPTISPNSASTLPSWPREMAPIGYTRAAAARCAWRTMNPTAAWLSVTGSVFGIAQTAVSPRPHARGGGVPLPWPPQLAQARRRPAGTGPPYVPLRRWSPDRESRCVGRRPHPNRFQRRDSLDLGEESGCRVAPGRVV